MDRKLIFVLLTATALLIIGLAYRLSAETLSSSTSPNRKYEVEISQKKGVIGFQRRVYLSASRNGEQFVKNKLLYTGGRLDDEFTKIYPHYTWVSESVLKLGEKIDDTHRNGLRITNASPHRISYLLVEVFSDKYILFDIEPQSIVDLKFQFHGKLSCQGEFAESKQRFGSAVKISNDIQDKVRGDFSITIDEKNAVIKSPVVSLKETSCCAADRPSMDNENSWWNLLL